MDVSYRALEIAQDKLKLDRLPPVQRERLSLRHGSLIYRDAALEGYDAAAVVEVVEHLDPPRLAAFERCVFEFAPPPAQLRLRRRTPSITRSLRPCPPVSFRHKDQSV